MKIRLLLDTIFVIGLGTSMYCTQKAPVVLAAQPESIICCGADPTAPDSSSAPTVPSPRPKPTK